MKASNGSLDMLRMLWTEGMAHKKRFDAGVSRNEYNVFHSEVVGWVGRVKLIVRNVFYNIKFHDDYVSALREAYDCDDGCNVGLALSITIEYIRSLGQLLKFGYIKDPVSGVDNTGSKICFVAMWFDPTMEDIYNYGIYKPMTDLGYEVIRVDKHQHNDRIDAKIFEIIRKSRFLVADFTGNRSGVYYEAGFASGQGIPVVHTCRFDYMNQLHFDVKTINTIGYSDSAGLADALTGRVVPTIGWYVETQKQQKDLEEFPF